jgi:hypothetical protein
MMMTSRAPDKTGSGPVVQRTAVFSAAVLLLVMGTGLAFAAGAANSSRVSTPAVIASDRPVQRVPSAIASVTVGAAAPVAAQPAHPEKSPDKHGQPKVTQPTSSAGSKPRPSSGSAKKKRREDDERETGTPPVREDDDDEGDEDDHETVATPVRDDHEDHESH